MDRCLSGSGFLSSGPFVHQEQLFWLNRIKGPRISVRSGPGRCPDGCSCTARAFCRRQKMRKDGHLTRCDRSMVASFFTVVTKSQAVVSGEQRLERRIPHDAGPDCRYDNCFKVSSAKFVYAAGGDGSQCFHQHSGGDGDRFRL